MVDPLLLLGTACAGAAASAAASALLYGDQVRRMRTKLVECRMALAGQRAGDEQQRVLCRGMMDDPSRMAIRFDRHGKAIFVSPSCATITGYAPEQLLGDQVFPLLHALDEPALRAAVHAGTGLPV